MAAFSSGRVQEDSESDEGDDVEPEEEREKSGGQRCADGECDSLIQRRRREAPRVFPPSSTAEKNSAVVLFFRPMGCDFFPWCGVWVSLGRVERPSRLCNPSARCVRLVTETTKATGRLIMLPRPSPASPCLFLHSIGTTCASGLHSATRSRLAERGASSVPLKKVLAAESRTFTGDPPSPHNLPVVGIRYSTSGNTQQSRLDGKRQLATLRDERAVETSNVAVEALVAKARGAELNEVLGNDGEMAEHPSIAIKGAASGGGDALFIDGGGGSDSATASVRGGTKREISGSSPAARAAKILMTPSNAPASGGTRIAFGSAGGRAKAPANKADDRTMRTPVSTPPLSGASSFLYEANNTLPALLGSADDSDDDPSSKAEGTSPTSPSAVAAATVGELPLIGPAFSACHALAADFRGGSATRGVGMSPTDGAMRDVFFGGPSAMAKFSSIWRRSRCFSFVLGSRSLQWVEDRRTGRGGRCLYRRSWETLTSRLTVAPYTVPSAGESFIPLSRRESEDA